MIPAALETDDFMRWEDLAGYLASQTHPRRFFLTPKELGDLHRSLRSYRNQMFRQVCWRREGLCFHNKDCPYFNDTMTLLMKTNGTSKLASMLGLTSQVVKATIGLCKPAAYEEFNCRIGNSMHLFQQMDAEVQLMRHPPNGKDALIHVSHYYKLRRWARNLVKRQRKLTTKLVCESDMLAMANRMTRENNRNRLKVARSTTAFLRDRGI